MPADQSTNIGPTVMWEQPSLDHILEQVARAICQAEEVEPEKPCVGVGVLIPAGETWPAWRVRLPRARAAIGKLDELGCFRVPTRRIRAAGERWEQLIGGPAA